MIMCADEMLDVLGRVETTNSRVTAYEKAVAEEVTKARMVAQTGKALREEVATLKEDVEVYADVALLFQTFSEQEQRVVQAKFEQLISYALTLIFSDHFKQFRLNAGVERNQVVLNPTLVFDVDGGVEVTSEIMGAHGGGPSDVIGFMLKLLVVIFNGKSKVRPILFLDETFSHLSDEYLPAMGEVIRKFVDELDSDLQVVLVTHQKEFVDVADVAYKFSLNEDTKHTVVEKLT
jgi:DNA repair exonuclease SbcCD ATPase subunit